MSADEQHHHPVAPAAASAWARPHRKERQPVLSRARIVAAALRLLDAEGMEALSMRKLGAEMGAAATSLYRHVTGKDEVIELALDEVCGELVVPAADAPGDWREAVSRSGHNLRAMTLRHPWVASVLGQVGPAHLGPNLMRMSERMLALFQTAGFPASEAAPAMTAVVSYVVGATSGEAAHLSRIARGGQSERNPRALRDENFDYGLQRILDGLQARLAHA
ncbi:MULTISPECIES: TetR/AcrR family transcriptional regulator [Streptomyces]|uniref:TetR/AcrR family transcriptional regulator n=1 Tax=Streptomyces TaxID=1883 RepID=UPI0004BD032C|nr:MULTISPECIES: TetR/AcrR family transcriptional regulator [Streptomyces]KOU10242.1 TetR family transcriptional regulator [Streptomyces sp. WM6349]KOU93900.1 TetR family transcriptional regulator [Streptomyces sp. XY533]KOV41044.1 TetR family transcriptional regulator [Streptomyces sp. H036]MBP2347724.1 AcrR family transcriptional regulator [Streptomyces virginiae]MCI4085995.1 TetR/AcrR family transcriptional regulator [Streptomyces sp. MMS21 TC-5]